MRRGGRGNWNRPLLSFGGRPRGLKGREIGFYYRDRQRMKSKNQMALEVPAPIIAALQAHIAVIEVIAQQENIYLPPQKKLEFFKPNSSLFDAGADFIPLRAVKSEVQSHSVTNIPFWDDEVIFVDKVPAPNKNIMTVEHNVTDNTNNAKKHETDIKPLISDEIISLDDTDIIESKIKVKEEFIGNDDDVIVLDYNEKDIKRVKIEDVKPVVKTIEQTVTEDTSNAKKNESDRKPLISEEVISLDDAGIIQSKIKVKKEFISGDDDVIVLDYNEKDIKRVKIEDVKPVAEDKKPVKIEDVEPITLDDDNVSQRELGSSRQNQRYNTHYKYSYDDIITGTFQEKLDECIAKGIDINTRNFETALLNPALLEEYKLMNDGARFKYMLKFRETLPAYKKAQDVLQVMNENQVVVISGETGCGKSTQVPQIILDDAMKNRKGAHVKILVTQPRRIAASSLAMRVAEERGEDMGNSVGYAVRLERVECRARGSIMFCTTGVLLVEMETDQNLSNYSHIILDEVHERDCHIDISMCMLKQVLQKRKDLKLILMSATIDAETLCAYFDNCPLLHIEGLAFPVEDVYLEKILDMTKYQLPPKEVQYQNIKPEKPWMKYQTKRKDDGMEKDIKYHAEIGPWLESIKKSLNVDVYKTLQDRRIEDLNIDLIFELLRCISRGDPGAILVFLPGIADITKLMRLMCESRQFPESLYEIHPLHSKLSTITQQKIFKRPPGHIRKIIIATNVAETSITIDDIVYVVDCAKMKYNGLNVEDHVTTLQVEWASQANLRQRRGRAGRCQPGICYHLVSSYRATCLPERMLPELQRNNLLEPVLQLKRLRLGIADQALKLMPAVPDEKTIERAVKHLQQCGALDEKETLTPLGWHLARLPVHPAAGKLLLFGALFGCLERAASVAAVWGFKDPFLLVPGKERDIDEAKKTLALGEPSDHIVISEALMQWERCGTNKGAFAREYFLSWSNLKLLSEMKNQFGHNLKQMGFLQSGDVRSTWENRNTDNLALFKAIVAASLYPNVGTVQWKNLEPGRNPNAVPEIKVRTPEDADVKVHPSSVMSVKHDRRSRGPGLPLCAEPGANWLVYWLKQRSTALYLIDVTLVYTLPLLFFGELKVSQSEKRNECVIDIRSVEVRCAMETTQLLYQLRALLDQVLASKIMLCRGGKRSSDFEENVLNAVIRLITAEDARTQYMGDNNEQSDSCDRRRWR